MTLLKSLLIGLAVYLFYRVFRNLFLTHKSSAQDDVHQLKICSKCGTHVVAQKISYINGEPVCKDCRK